MTITGGGTGGGGGSGGGGIQSINTSTVPAQVMQGTAGIVVSTNVASGVTTIHGQGTTGINFIDHEVVAGTGTAWILQVTPNPIASLQLFQELPNFGSVLLQSGVDYTISGTAIATVNSIAAGSLIAWYRY